MKKGLIIAIIVLLSLILIFLAALCAIVVTNENIMLAIMPSYPVQDNTQPHPSDKDHATEATALPTMTTNAQCKNGHEEVVLEAVAPSCTSTGLTEGAYCSVCQQVIVEQEVVEKLAHTEVNMEAVAPSCTEEGLTEGKYCAVCQTIIQEQKTVAALGHTEVTDAAVASTCTATGLTEGKHCSVCGTVLVKQTVVYQTAHTMVIDQGKEATCTQPGLTEGRHCSVCGFVEYPQYTVDALGHSYSDWKITKNATCTATGTKSRSCTRCGDKETETIEKSAHTYSGGKCAVCKAVQPASEGLKFELSDDGKSYYCAGWKNYSSWGTKSVVIPASYNGKPVIGIANSAFVCSDMVEVILPEGLKEIGSMAFYMCENLKSVWIPDSVTYMSGNAFNECGNLETVYINTTGWKKGYESVDFGDPYTAANILRKYSAYDFRRQ